MEYVYVYLLITLAIQPGAIDCTGNLTCPQFCTCSYDNRQQLGVECKSHSLVQTTAALPIHTVHFKYWAQERKISLEFSNFTKAPNMETLHIAVASDYLVFQHFVRLRLFRQTVFAPLTKLKVLRIHANWEFHTPMPQLFLHQTNLEVLDLSFTRNINYSALRETLTSLKINSVLHTLLLRNTQTLESLVNGFAFNMSHFLEPIQHCPLRELDLSYNSLKTIYPGLLERAPGLTSIVVRNHMLYPLATSAFLLEVIMHPSIKEADFSEQGYGIPLPPYPWNKTDSARLTSSDQLQDYPYQCNQTLIKTKYLCTLFNKRICNATYELFQKNHDEFCSFLYTTIPHSFEGIACSAIPVIDKLLRDNCTDCMVFPSYGNIRHLKLNNLNIYDQTRIDGTIINHGRCFHPNKLEQIDISSIYPYGYADFDWILRTPVTGFNNLKVVKASHCNLQVPYFNLTSTFPNISSIDFSNNKMNLELFRGQYFIGAPTVTDFDLSHNLIAIVPEHTLHTMIALKHLNLSHNLLTNFTMNMSHLPNLKTIDLSYNQISSISPSMILQFNILAASSRNKGMKVNLDSNSLLCTCNERPFIQWLQNGESHNVTFENLVGYKCTDRESTRVKVLDVDLQQMKLICHSSAFYISISAASVAVLAGLVAGLAVFLYKRRWWFRYQCFLVKKKYRKWQLEQMDAVKVYDYDAFVSYNCRDELWVNEELQPKLEGEFNLKLCLHERDFELGENIMEQISASIENSRKTLLILSPNFLASTFCHWEMNLAQNKLLSEGQDVLLLAILSPMSEVKMSRVLKDLLEKKTYVRWTDDPDGQRLFWDKLHQAIKMQRAEPYELEEGGQRRHLIQEEG